MCLCTMFYWEVDTFYQAVDYELPGWDTNYVLLVCVQCRTGPWSIFYWAIGHVVLGRGHVLPVRG